MHCLTLEFKAFLVVFVRILLQIEETDTLPFIQWEGGVNAREGGGRQTSLGLDGCGPWRKIFLVSFERADCVRGVLKVPVLTLFNPGGGPILPRFKTFLTFLIRRGDFPKIYL